MTTYPCPVCGAPADLAAGCSGCGREPDPRAAEVVRLNGELAALAPRMREALDAYQALAAEFHTTRRRRDELADGVRQAVAYARFGARPAPPSQPAPPPAPPAGERVARVEARPVTVQNLLFVLGGLLVGAAAVVFTGVAWATYGAVGRSVALAVVTLLGLAVPPLAARRGLRGTAETFAAIAMLLVVLDGYGAWYVDLFGLGAVPGAAYAAGVCAVTAAVGVAYGLATGLSAPRFAALVAVQPAAPLLAAEGEAGARGWALAFTVVAVANLAVARLAGRETRVTAWALYGCAQTLSGVCALVALLGPGPVGWPALAGGPALLSAAVLVAASRLAGRPPLRAVAAALATLAVGGAVVRPLAQLTPSVLLAAAAATVLALGVAAHLLAARTRPDPEAARSEGRPEALGARVGALLAVALLAPFAVGMALVNAVGTLAASLPAWRGEAGTGAPFDWQVPVAVALGTAALVLAAPVIWRRGLAVAGVAVALLGLPVPWWALVPLELAAAAALALAVSRRVPAVAGPAAAVLAAHAVSVSLVRPWSATAALAALVAIGVAALATGDRTTAAARPPTTDQAAVHDRTTAATRPPTRDQTAVHDRTTAAAQGFNRDQSAAGDRTAGAAPAEAGDQRAAHDRTTVAGSWGASLSPSARTAGRERAAGVVRRVAFGVGLVSWPAAAACAVFAAGGGQPWPARVGLVAAALLLLPVAVLGARAIRPYAVAGLAVAVVGAALWPDLAGVGEPDGLYPALGVLVLAAAYRAVRPSGRVSLGAAAVPHGVALLTVLVPLSYVLLLAPYGWLADIWTGAPGAGADGTVPSGGPAAVLLVAAALGLVGRYAAAALVGVVGLVAVAAAAQAPWPVVPAALLASGAALVLAVTLRDGGRVWGVPLGCLMAAPGLAGLLPTEAATLAGLAFVVVAAAVVGVSGATAAVRVGGWLAGVVAGGALAVAATLAAGAPWGRAAYPVLAVAALALGLAALLRRSPARGAERVALDAAAHATAAVALLVTIGDARHAAALCTLWAAAVAARAVAPGEPARRPFALVAGASLLLAWWLLLGAERVALTEAYTLPAALLALAAGHVALRGRPGIGSWVGYAPGLGIALLPSLASVLVADGQGVRRLLLGLGALLAVLAGAYERRQAPLVVGGAVLVVVALHEMLVWDLLPRWAYLAIGGLVLIAVAMTYERRLRDLRRLRGAIARMT